MLKAMGWREGQGIGARVMKRKKIGKMKRRLIFSEF